MKSLCTTGIALFVLVASGWVSAAPLNIPELCGAEFVENPENRIYRGKFKNYRGTLETALVITPIKDEGETVVFYLYGVEPKWNIELPGCVRAMGTEKGETLTLFLRGGSVRVTYKFSGDEASAKYKTNRGTTKGKVTLSEM